MNRPGCLIESACMGFKSQAKINRIHLTFKDDTSHKFWEISVEGTTHQVRYGRIGSEGQTKTKSFASGAAAQDNADKLVRSKERKGYVREGSNQPAKKIATTGHPVVQASLQKALQSLAPKIQSLPDTLSAAQCKEMFENSPDTFEDLLSPLGDEIYFSWSFARMWISFAALGDALAPQGFNKDKDLHFGDLHIHGDLDLTENLTVLGSLRVDGVITQDTCEYAVLLVAGDLQVRGFDVRGRTWVGGEVQSDYLQLSRWGFLYAGSGIRSTLVVRNAFESGIRCEFNASHFIDTTMLEEDEALQTLSDVLVPAAMEDSEEYFDPDAALALAGEAKRFLKQAPGATETFPRIADEY